ncbi:MAG TPA: NAD(P)/FAD-dependent oxidoreductase [Polyangiaceae bacterium]|jgi:flavin-dependent dehydrogenase|nr:NAD(P)/FAD-dependent oxidoreductase [Polyangiaceae bacterium]
MPSVTSADVVVLGGGPGGSVCAARLASLGRRVVVLERDRHPRFHLGESLLPGSLDVLDAIGVLDAVRSRFIVKRGARFVDGADGSRAVRYAFADAFRPRWDSAFQVSRDEFDELLFRHAGQCGATLREGWRGERVVYEDGRAAGVDAVAADGSHERIGARFVVDATGRDAMTARAAGGLERIGGLDHTALFTQVRGGFRDEGDREGDIQIVLFGHDLSGRGGVGAASPAGAPSSGGEASSAHAPSTRGWFWLIPFADGRTSVGAVVPSGWVRAQGGEGGPGRLFESVLDLAPAVREMLAGSERLFAPRATGDFSFRVKGLRGPGWLAVGDAAGFIDPLFSTGVHLAMTGALRAADAIHRVLGAASAGAGSVNASDAAAAAENTLATWEREHRAGAELFLGAVQAFYSNELVSYLFAEPQHPFLRRAITSLLAGDVFDGDAVWSREMRTRFPSR